MTATMKDKIGTLLILSTALLFFSPEKVMTATEPPVVEELRPAGAAVNDRFGQSVSLSSDIGVFGAPGTARNGTESGAVHVFSRSGNSWQQKDMLVPDDGMAGDAFGGSVSISGDTIVIGAAGEDDQGAESGAVYVFGRSGTDWVQQAKLVADDGAAGDGFGFDVAIDGDVVVVGAPFDDGNGSVYTFIRSAGTWEKQSKLLAYGGGVAGDRFGCSVDIAYDTIIIGADGDDNTATDDGSAFIYTPYGSGWRYQRKITAGDASEGDRFGWSVAMGLETALVGTNRAQNESASRQGAAYVFARQAGGTWTEQQRFAGSSQGTDDGFGFHVALYDNFFLIGVPRESIDGINAGAVYVFSRAESDPWPLHAKYPGSISGSGFGTQAAVFGDTVIAGAPGQGEGSAYAFMYPGSLGLYLPSHDWRMISRPCYNTNPASTLFGDDIEAGIYAKTWTMYRIEPEKATRANPYGYFQLQATEPLAEGVGYWIYSVKDGILDVQGLPTPIHDSNECPSVNGCAEAPLAWLSSGVVSRNNQVGNPLPFAVDWADVIVVVTPGDGSAPVALTPSEAYAKKFMRNTFYRYENKKYSPASDITPGMRGIIRPFESVWVHTLDPQHHAFPASAIKLLFPVPGL